MDIDDWISDAGPQRLAIFQWIIWIVNSYLTSANMCFPIVIYTVFCSLGWSGNLACGR